ncbi:cytosine deaminase [Ancylobacter sp. 6x-1]|uniref:Cytosine deaminase n=1 Tax=Ancylobacter crimeensis TaxID=2579147 RepID=A0ABT0DGF2_9HYPH|nr:cytosine deaminase [Ancylobacter crimeensis]MCK0198954.1 cytosine deaminase [Ancylobacter crimeensis]
MSPMELVRAAFETEPDRYRLAGVRAPACLLRGNPAPGLLATTPDAENLVRLDIDIADGRIAALALAGTIPLPDGAMAIPLDGGLVLPGLVDMHTHLDKAHIWHRAPNPDGSFAGALKAAADDAANWTETDLLARMTRGLQSAHAHGTVALRTHLDSVGPQAETAWQVFAGLRVEWAGRIALQAVSLVPVDLAADAAALAPVVVLTARHGGTLGGFLYRTPQLEAGLANLFAAAERHGLDLDLHVDETGDPEAQGLLALARMARARRFAGRIIAGHCCSLARQDADTAARTMDAVAEAGIAVVSLPMCNLYLQDRATGRTPLWRGVTLLHELKARGVKVMVASDNVRDPFYPHGDFDMIEVWREATRILHLDHPIGDWPAAIAAAPAAAMGLDGVGTLAPGAPADLIVTAARGVHALFARPGAPRLVLRAGRLLSAELPDRAEDDDRSAPREDARL